MAVGQATTPDKITASPLLSLSTPTFHTIEMKNIEKFVAIFAFAQDKKDYLWMATDIGLIRYDGYEFKPFLFSDKTTALHDIVLDKNGWLWLATHFDGIYKYNPSTNESVHFSKNKSLGLSSNIVVNLHASENGIWAGTANGLDVINFDDSSISHFLTRKQKIQILDIAEDKAGTVWVGTNKGLYRKEKEAKEFSDLSITNPLFKALSHAKIKTIMINDNAIWITTILSGVWRYSLQKNTLKRMPFIDNIPPLVRSAMILKDSLWVATDGQGIIIFDMRKNNIIRQILPDASLKNTLLEEHVKSLYLDNSGLVWISNRTKGLQVYNPFNEAFLSLQKKSKSSKGLSFSKPRAITELLDGSIAVSSKENFTIDLIDQQTGLLNSINLPLTYNGNEQFLSPSTLLATDEQSLWIGGYPAYLSRYDLTTKDLKHYRLPLKNQRHGEVLKLIKDPFDNSIWLAMSEGILHFSLDSMEFIDVDYQFNGATWALSFDLNGNLWTGNQHGIFVRYRDDGKWRHYNNNNSNSTFSDTRVKGILIDSKNRKFISTTSDLYLVTKLSKESALFSSVFNELQVDKETVTAVNNLLEDNSGNIWVGKDLFFNPNTWQHQLISEQEIPDRLTYTSIHYKTTDGQLLLGGAYSLTAIDPQKLVFRQFDPSIVLDDVRLDGESIMALNHKVTVVSAIKRVTLQFKAISIYQAESLTYQYRLVGFNDKWLTANPSLRQQSYTSLPPGNYRFEVKVKNRFGVMSPKLLSTALVILPAIYQTWWFRALCLFVTLALFWYLHNHRLKSVTLRQQEQLDKKLALERAELMTELVEKKNKLLADVSHELRTPLTVLKLQVESLQHNLEEDVAASYLALDNKLSDIGRLISEIYLLAQSDIGALELNFTQLNFHHAIELWADEFEYLITKKDLKWGFKNNTPELLIINADRDKLKQVINNLLNNSILYTDKPGIIHLSTFVDNEQLFIVVEDSSPSVPEDEQSQIFERLYRVEQSRSRETGGSGLGLAICRGLIEAHDGLITAETSRLNGLKIVISLPLAD